MKPKHFRPLLTVAALLTLIDTGSLSTSLSAQSATLSKTDATNSGLPALVDQLFNVVDGQSTSFVREIYLGLNKAPGTLKAKELEAQILQRSSTRQLSDASKRAISELLGWIGSSKSTQLLAKWSTESAVSDAALRSLAMIPAAEADAELIKLLATASPASQPAILGALGQRRASKAVKAIKPLITSADRQLAVAAIDALSRIATRDAVTALTEAKLAGETEEARIWGLLNAAHVQVQAGDNRSAEKIFRQLLQTSQPLSAAQRVAAGTGLLDAAGADGLNDTRSLLLSAEDNAGVRLAPAWLRAATDLNSSGSNKAIEALEKEFSKLSANVQLVLLENAQQIGSERSLSLVKLGLKSTDQTVRNAALGALSACTNDLRELKPLIDALEVPSDREVAIASLSRSRASGLNEQLRSLFSKASLPAQTALITIAANRVDRDMFRAVIDGAKSSNRDLRQASFRALASLARSEDLAGLLGLRSEIRTGPERRAWHEAVLTVVRGSETPDKAAALLAEYLPAAAANERNTFAIALTLLASAEADKQLKALLSDADEARRKDAVRALSTARNVKAAALLVEVAEASKDETEQLLALRGYIETIEALTLPTDEKLTAYRRALKVATRDEERLAVLSGVDKLRGPDVKVLSKELHQLLPSAPPAPPSLL